MGLARALAQKGDDVHAERAFRLAIEVVPGWWAPHNALGVFLLYRGRLPEAVEAFQQAIRTSPDNTRPITNLGGAYQQLGRYAEAIAEYERSIRIRPTPFALSNLGTCQFQLRHFAAAADAYRRAAAMQPESAVIWLNLGDALRWAGDSEAEAMAAYRRAIELAEADLAVTPLDADRHATLALALAWSGETERARRHAARALEIDGTNSYILYQAALVDLAAGDTHGAIEGITRAIRAGYPLDTVLSDPQIEPLMKEPEFATIVANPQIR
jgi:tetratricopeptide (TPR) repeat protein